MFAIVGLGNPGKKYEQTRHNVGFLVVERLTSNLDCGAAVCWENKFGGLVARSLFSGKDIFFILPQLYMNRSGEVVSAIANYYKILPSSILVIHDDLDLAAGALRFKIGGSAGGHKGVRDIIAHLGSEDFYRLRIGIGHPGSGANVDSWVTGSLSSEARLDLKRNVEIAAEAVSDFILEGLVTAQNKYHSL